MCLLFSKVGQTQTSAAKWARPTQPDSAGMWNGSETGVLLAYANFITSNFITAVFQKKSTNPCLCYFISLVRFFWLYILAKFGTYMIFTSQLYSSPIHFRDSTFYSATSISEVWDLRFEKSGSRNMVQETWFEKSGWLDEMDKNGQKWIKMAENG